MSSSDAIKGTNLQRLTDLMDNLDDGITVDQLLMDKMVTGLNDSHLRQKLYKVGEDLAMEKALPTIRICAAKHKSQGMTVNYLKGKDKVQTKARISPTTIRRSRAPKGQGPEPRQQGQVWEMHKRNPSAKTEMPSS